MPAGADGPSTPVQDKAARKPRQAGSGLSPAATVTAPRSSADGTHAPTSPAVPPAESAESTNSLDGLALEESAKQPPATPPPQASSWEWVEGRQRTPNGVEKTFERRLVGNHALDLAPAPAPAPAAAHIPQQPWRDPTAALTAGGQGRVSPTRETWLGGPSKEITEQARRMEGRNLQMLFGAQAEEAGGKVSPPPSDSLVSPTKSASGRVHGQGGSDSSYVDHAQLKTKVKSLSPISASSSLIQSTAASAARPLPQRPVEWRRSAVSKHNKATKQQSNRHKPLVEH